MCSLLRESACRTVKPDLKYQQDTVYMSVTISVFILGYQLLAYFYEVVVENTMVNFYDYFSIHFSLSTIDLLL